MKRIEIFVFHQDEEDNENDDDDDDNASDIAAAPTPPLTLDDDGQSVLLSFNPFEIKTLRLVLKQ